MPFLIQLISSTPERTRLLPSGKTIAAYNAKIEMDDYIEEFSLTNEWWKTSDYEQQWREGIERLKHHATSCLVIIVAGSMATVAVRSPYLRIQLWALYREGDMVTIQRHVYHHANSPYVWRKRPFTPQTCYRYVSPYQMHVDLNQKASRSSVALLSLKENPAVAAEWKVSFSDMLASIQDGQKLVY